MVSTSSSSWNCLPFDPLQDCSLVCVYKWMCCSLSDDLKDTIRQIGGLGPVINLVSSTNDDIVKHALILIVELALSCKYTVYYERLNG